MFAQNPKREFVVGYDIEKVREAVLKLNATEPDYYIIVKDDKTLNEIKFHQKGQFLDLGYHIDFILQKLSEVETKVVVEVSRNLGAINTSGEVSIANNSLKSVTSKFSAFLSGDVNEETGKPNLPQQGCLLTTLITIVLFTAMVYAGCRIFHL
jgi:hypothetical protein